MGGYELTHRGHGMGEHSCKVDTFSKSRLNVAQSFSLTLCQTGEFVVLLLSKPFPIDRGLKLLQKAG